ncbi:MAG TPA: hypothetical protein PKE39_12790 [Ignavibacteria bacterium]|nr:hypothetical protein [Ignavibacteria bacterium]
MKKPYLLLLLAFLCLLFANNSFLYADEGDSITYKRNLWFYAQRFNPHDSIPPGAMQNALSERNALLANGYYLNPMSNNWINIGPNYPWNGGRVNFVKYADANTVIIGAPHGGLWRTTNNSTWVSMDPNNQLGSNHSGSIAIDNSHNPPFIYYGTGEGIYGFDYAYFGKGIFKTTDWGNTWEEINNGLPINLFLKVFRITIRPEHPDEIFAATNQGLYRTSTGGINWFVIDGTYGKNCNDIKFSYQEPLKAFLVGPSEGNRYIPGVGYRESTDGGLTFEVKDRGFNPSGRSHIEVFEQNDNYIFAISDIDDNTKLYRSTNGGLNFIQKFATNMTNYGGYVMSLKVVLPEQGDVPIDIYLGGIDLYKSTNTGDDFCRITGDPVECGYSNIGQHDDNHFIDVKPGSVNDISVVNDGGIIKTSNGGYGWESFNSNLSLSLIYRINSGSNGTFLGIQDNGIGTLTTPNGMPSKKWTKN